MSHRNDAPWGQESTPPPARPAGGYYGTPHQPPPSHQPPPPHQASPPHQTAPQQQHHQGSQQHQGYPPQHHQPPPPRWNGPSEREWPEPYEPEDSYPEDPYELDDEPGHGHGHSHSHSGGDFPVSERTTRIVTIVLIPIILLTALGVMLLWPHKVKTADVSGATSAGERAYGHVLTTTESACPAQQSALGGPAMPCGTAKVHVDSGPGNGQDVTVSLPQGPGSPLLKVGDKVVLAYQPNATADQQWAVTDHQRGTPLVIMIIAACLVVVAFGRLQGFAALGALAVSFAGLLFFIIPAILNGESPLLVAIVGTTAIMLTILYMTHGINVNTSMAVLGTFGSLVVTGLLGVLFTWTTQLTGFGSEESLYLSILQGNVDMRGLLLAGIIIGALGVLNDVTVTQAMAVAEMAPTATSRLDLYRAATRVGRAHVASAVNTIILAYAGASLPLLLLLVAGGRDVSDLLTSEFLTQEIVRSAVGAIGLVAAVPITTGLATLVADIRHSPARRRSPPRPHPAG